ncbi:hypothetical protein BBOV_II000320 [Babesia bovis T2Bo]|uniref:hypothetical protein n=1 Tax=Babesia bovis T2Bo TaxID=484906 RepID=UPI001C34459F|nr:hypothetical protein BBOV_II000320 [Babesia bovis T2Bo]EDO05993.2 hypothetical protein BBOV_II000320 [Babesia bovis T2Bo]
MSSPKRESANNALNKGSTAECLTATAAKDEKVQPKLPRMFTHQVLIGFLNDIFSMCTFTRRPSISVKLVDLIESGPFTDREYMLVLRFEKKGVAYELLSHDFAAAIKGYNTAKADELLHKAETLSVGVASALVSSLSKPTVFHQIPTSILKNFVPKGLNRGGLWAYMSLPSFLGGGVRDDKVVRERMARIINSANEGIRPITGATIVSLLRILYYMKAETFLRPVCVALCQEYIECCNDIISSPPVLHFGTSAGVFTNEFLLQHVSTHLNNVNVLGMLSNEDLVLLIASFKGSSTLNLTYVRKILMLLTEEAEFLSAECALSLICVLVKLGYSFDTKTALTRLILFRLASAIEELPKRSLILLSGLGLVRSDLPHYNIVLDNVLLKFHLIDPNDLILIGASYAYAKHLFAHDDALRLTEPRSNHIFHCLEFYVNKALWTTLLENERLIPFMFDGDSLTKNIEQKNDSKLTNSWTTRSATERSSRRGFGSNSTAPSATKEDLKFERLSSMAPSSNSSKLYYLNLVEDSCLRFAELDFNALCLILFSLLVSNIDVSPIHEATLVAQGFMLRKGLNPVQIKEVPSSESGRQHKLCYEILQYAQHPNNAESPLMFDNIRAYYPPVEVIPAVPVAPTVVSPIAIAATPSNGSDTPILSAPDLKHSAGISEKAASPISSPKSQSTSPGPTPIPEIKVDDQVFHAISSLTSALKGKTGNTTLTPEDVLRMYVSVLFSHGDSTTSKADDSELDTPREAGTSHIAGGNTKDNELSHNSQKDVKAAHGPTHAVDSTKGSKRQPVLSDNECKYKLFFSIRPVCYYRAKLVKRRAAVRYTYVKVNTRFR